MWQATPTGRSAGHVGGLGVEPLGLGQGDAELVLGLAGGDLGVAAGLDVGIDPDGDGGARAQPLGDRGRPGRSSGSDSTLISATPVSSAKAISASVLPTPEKTMRSGGTPAASARRISPSETMSAPAPSSARVRSTARLELAFTA